MIQKELSAVHWPVQLPGMGWIDFLEKELNSNKNTIPTNPILLKLNHQLSWIMQTHACVNESLCFSHESFASHYVLPILDIEVKNKNLTKSKALLIFQLKGG